MDRDTYLDHLRRESDALLAAAAVDLSRPVPACPDWDVADLVWHIAWVHDRWATIAAEALTDATDVEALERPDRPADEELAGFARDRADRLVDVLAGLEPDAPRWNWTGREQTAAWIWRRMALETAVHRVDAEQAEGEAAPVDPALAADGIDELLTVFLPDQGDYRGPAGFVGVFETDRGRAWALQLDPPQVQLVSPMKVPKRPDALEQLRGDASQLFLLLWGRARHGSLGKLGAALRDHLDRD